MHWCIQKKWIMEENKWLFYYTLNLHDENKIKTCFIMFFLLIIYKKFVKKIVSFASINVLKKIFIYIVIINIHRLICVWLVNRLFHFILIRICLHISVYALICLPRCLLCTSYYISSLKTTIDILLLRTYINIQQLVHHSFKSYI